MVKKTALLWPITSAAATSPMWRAANFAVGNMPAPPNTKGLSYGDLRKICLDAARQWPGCETIGGIQIIRKNDGGFTVRVTLYGTAKKSLADRAMRAVERSVKNDFHLTE